MVGLYRRYPHFNEAARDRFIFENAVLVIEILAQEEVLVQQKASSTALLLIDPKRLRPYEPPLGDNDP